MRTRGRPRETSSDGCARQTEVQISSSGQTGDETERPQFSFNGIYDADPDTEVLREEAGGTIDFTAVLKHKERIGLQRTVAILFIVLGVGGLGLFLAFDKMEAAARWGLFVGPLIGFIVRALFKSEDPP